MAKGAGYTRGIVYYRILFRIDVGKESRTFPESHAERLPMWKKYQEECFQIFEISGLTFRKKAGSIVVILQRERRDLNE